MSAVRVVIVLDGTVVDKRADVGARALVKKGGIGG